MNENSIDNKTVINNLCAYFEKECDPEIVRRSLAALMIDIHRISKLNKLPKEEKKCLIYRIKLNAQQLEHFIKNGPRGPLVYDKSINTENQNE